MHKWMRLRKIVSTKWLHNNSFCVILNFYELIVAICSNQYDITRNGFNKSGCTAILTWKQRKSEMKLDYSWITQCCLLQFKLVIFLTKTLSEDNII